MVAWNWLTNDGNGPTLWVDEPKFNGKYWAGDGQMQTIPLLAAERMLKRKLHPCECVRLSDKTSEIIYF